ncbi:MAG: hypothetical protein GIKADHBN_00372 [Phycisphaerales bacterium]|nr:hypothetical protein [Phycisphaerales bacterium]
MRRGQERRTHAGETYTKQQLLEAADISGKTFDMIRKAARIKGPPHGGLNWEFSREEVETLIHRAASGRFTERGAPAALAWRKLLDDGPPGAAREGDGE